MFFIFAQIENEKKRDPDFKIFFWQKIFLSIDQDVRIKCI